MSWFGSLLCPAPPQPDAQLRERIILHEGTNRYAYTDSLGFLTIGTGRCIDPRRGRGLSADESSLLLTNDIAACVAELEPYIWFRAQTVVRRGALIELCFNLGLNGLLEFTKMQEALIQADYTAAGNELKASLWYRQVGSGRGDDIIMRLQEGRYA